jgi:seryl-tRNA synthetase
VTSGSALVPTLATGVYLSTGDFETIVRGLTSALGTLASDDGRQSLRTPPVIAREIIEKVGYHESFPHLLGRVFAGANAGTLAESDLVLLPAGCYCVYPVYAGTRLEAATELSVEATCFRQEADAEVGRLRSFRMREFVRLGTAEQCITWRDDRLTAARDWLAELGLETVSAVASDPFFGTGNRMMRMLQMERELKIELLAEVGPGQTQAIASGNYHTDKFGQVFAIVGPDGDVAHTACLAFGYERLALALMHRHGADAHRWPDRIRQVLNLGAAE